MATKRKRGKDRRYYRGKVFARDRGVCSACGRDCEAIDATIRPALETRDRPKIREKLAELGLSSASAWHMEHVVPLVEGGTYAISNLITLCAWCHVERTRAWQKGKLFRDHPKKGQSCSER